MHLLRLNFVTESMLDLAVEADVLFAPFCQDLGNGYYRFDQNVRLQLLQNLDPAYAEEPTPRSVLTARFLLSYIEQQCHKGVMAQDRLYTDYLEVERWAALGFHDPETTAAQLAAALQQAISSDEISARIRVAGLATALSTPLARYGKLLAYAAGLEAMETGRFDQAKQLLEGLDDTEIEIGKIKLKSPRSVLRERLHPPKETRTEKEDQTAEPQVTGTTRNAVFICYSHKDKKYLDELLTFLKPLQRKVVVDVWDDTRISLGSNWHEEIRQALLTTKVAVLLVSQNFLASDYIAKHELPLLQESVEREGIVILPVILSFCDFMDMPGLARFQTVNDPSIPLSKLSPAKRTEVLVRVANVINENFDSVVAIEPPEMRDGKPLLRYFVSYAHDDCVLKDRLLKHLELLLEIARDYRFVAWDDGEILVGEGWHEQIQQAIKHCHFGLIMVSPAFLGSAYIGKHDLPSLVANNIVIPGTERRVIPVALKHILFDGSMDLKGLEKLQFFRYGAGRAFQELNNENSRNKFVTELFQYIIKILNHYDLPSPIPISQTKLSKKDADRNHDQVYDEVILKDDTINQPKPARVFISSTYSDLKEQRQTVFQILRELGHEVIGMEDYSASDHPPLDNSYSEISACDVFIAIIGWRYGYVPKEGNPELLSITELEYREALRLAKPCLIFLLSEDAPWPLSFMDVNTGEGESGKRIQAFRDELMRKHGIGIFRTVDDLSIRVAEAMQAWKKFGAVTAKDQAGRGASTRQFDVFLSHNSRDKRIVRELTKALESRDLRVWLDEEQLVPGRPWQEALETIIQTTQAVVVLIGESGLGPWEEPEMRACLSEFVNRKLPVIPVLLPGTHAAPKLPLFLKSFTWVDLRGGLTEDGLDQLELGIRRRKGMIDIFICYSRTDSAIAKQLTERLEAEGWSVYLDVQTRIGTRWHKDIQAKLQEAKAVVALWSAKSTDSDFVLEEAEYGKRHNILFPALIESVGFPYGFGRIQTADMIGWTGEPDHPGLAQLLAALREHLGEERQPLAAKATLNSKNRDKIDGLILAIDDAILKFKTKNSFAASFKVRMGNKFKENIINLSHDNFSEAKKILDEYNKLEEQWAVKNIHQAGTNDQVTEKFNKNAIEILTEWKKKLYSLIGSN
ncbi:MAG: TIR domain-containing protein [Proteobacteria bacterium]|nr:TIR domain-containing protein [Pseudomonadota bacterium]